ncbi:MAG: phosphoribosylamine--glycine ligase [Phycisphaerae bacterium]
MKILLVGSGAREHALAWKLRQSPLCTELLIAPGNPGMAELGRCVDIRSDAVADLTRFAVDQAVDLVVVGPEDPLALGLIDALAAKNIRAFGPSLAGAQLEADKTFSKKIMREALIPTAEGKSFKSMRDAIAYVETRTDAMVVKAAGLARGKGVVICKDPVEALDVVRNIMEKKIFGAAGSTIVIEEKLEGPEISLLALIDGHTAYILESAQDHKRIGDHDQGPNTGGMGAFSPAPRMTDELGRKAESEIIVPLLDALARHEIDYRGIVYAGLMLTPAGPKTLEFNCRFGDPEAQVLMMRLKSDLVEAMLACIDRKLEQITLEWDPRPAVCVVLASSGYGWESDDKVVKGVPISGLQEAAAMPDVVIFHGGTAMRDGRLVTNGGRVLSVCALGDTLDQARQKAYAAVEKISFPGMQYRRDIGKSGG